jgi:hypothetical protein
VIGLLVVVGLVLLVIWMHAEDEDEIDSHKP